MGSNVPVMNESMNKMIYEMNCIGAKQSNAPASQGHGSNPLEVLNFSDLYLPLQKLHS